MEIDLSDTTVAITVPVLGGGPSILIASVTAPTIGIAIDSASIIAEELNIQGDYPVGRSDYMKNLLSDIVVREYEQFWKEGWKLR
jgi:hypothetical protein